MVRALLVVDVQRDFVEGGALGVAGGNAVAEAIFAHTVNTTYDLTIASADRHAPAPDDNCGHFALGDKVPDFVSSWPVHCVADSEGAGFHPALRTMQADEIVYKGYGTQSYSAFEGVTSDGRSLLAILRSAGVTDIDVVGIATDYCVKSTVMDGLGCDFRVRVLLDMCAGVAEATTNQAVTDMLKRGAVIVREGAQQ